MTPQGFCHLMQMRPQRSLGQNCRATMGGPEATKVLCSLCTSVVALVACSCGEWGGQLKKTERHDFQRKKKGWKKKKKQVTDLEIYKNSDYLCKYFEFRWPECL